MTNPKIRDARFKKLLARRYFKERVFHAFGLLAVLFSMACLVVLFTDIISKGSGAFRHAMVQLEVTYDPLTLGIDDPRNPEQLALGNFDGLVKAALLDSFPDVKDRRQKRELYGMVSASAGFLLADRLRESPELLGAKETLWLLLDDDIDSYVKSLDEKDGPFTGRTSERMRQWVDGLVASGDIDLQFNTDFFTGGDSREPETAGIWGAAKGSFFTLLVTLVLSFPIGVAAALYLEEFAPKNKWTDLIEVNINNLAAVPSIIFGLLGLAIFIGFFGIPRSIPLLGGLVLTLMTLPVIIISSRAAIKSVPPSIREAARGVGASPMQVALHHVLPLAMPGMLTGAIIGMARALGETAPLLMIGMVAFIADIPGGITSPSTVLPVQIFLWADSPERAFTEKTSAAIMVLLAFLLAMNMVAVWLRKRLEKRW
jgi:phosphate transport system permease protein